jgi:hypothetical protein
MLKSGQFALVTNDCVVRKGETVELVNTFCNSVGNRCRKTWLCWYNNVKVEIEESNLTPIKAERWKPEVDEWYYTIDDIPFRGRHLWRGDDMDICHYENYNVFKTAKERDAEAEATLADRKARLDK